MSAVLNVYIIYIRIYNVCIMYIYICVSYKYMYIYTYRDTRVYSLYIYNVLA